MISKIESEKIWGQKEPKRLVYYVHEDKQDKHFLDTFGKTIFDDILNYSNQEEINRIHIIDWFEHIIKKGLVDKKGVQFILNTLADYNTFDIIDYHLLVIGLERERLIEYTNEDYWLNGFFCADEDGTGHYLSRDI